MSNAWNDFVTGCRERYGVATVVNAREAGVAESTFYRRTERERWLEPYPGVRTAPWVHASSPYTELSALLQAAGDRAAATGATAAWLHGFRAPPSRLQVAVPHSRRVPVGAEGHVRRHRWLRDDDRAVVQQLSVLRVPAMAVTLADSPPLDLRALVIDALHHGRVEVAAIGARLAAVGPVPGRRQLARLLHELADRRVESIFHDMVLDELTRRGYRPGRAPVRVETPDGRGVHPDLPLATWLIAIEVQGDRFHRSRTARANDRRKTTQYAGSEWIVMEVDWWEWMGNRDHFLEALDAAIMAQVRRGVAAHTTLPPHLRLSQPRVQNHPMGADPTGSASVRTH